MINSNNNETVEEIKVKYTNQELEYYNILKNYEKYNKLLIKNENLLSKARKSYYTIGTNNEEVTLLQLEKFWKRKMNNILKNLNISEKAIIKDIKEIKK